MTTLDGVFGLRTPRDILEKLAHDFERFSTAPTASQQAQYALFDFLVTARHMPEWAEAAKLNVGSWNDRAVVEHIADGAKHFHITNAKHVSVSDTLIPEPHIDENEMVVYPQQLQIELADGQRISAMLFAQRVLGFWRGVVP
jgi:hypothetical protein